MTDYFAPHAGDTDPDAMSTLALAHMGDAVFELMVRAFLCRKGGLTAGDLHRKTVAMVEAGAQAEAAKKIEPFLSAGEQEIYRRGRNAKVHGVPKHASPADYHAATGLETLFGWLYLKGGTERLNRIFAVITED